MLYDRYYRILTEDEKLKWEKVEATFRKSSKDNSFSMLSISKYYKNIPRAALHYKQLFPNNYLNTDDLDNKQNILAITAEFESLLNSSISERDILNFIRIKKAYFIVGAILKMNFPFGHHGAFAFKEFELPPNYIVDYLLVGKNSDGYEFVFVEFENPNGQITNDDGEFGATIRKGIKQLADWDGWLETNYSSLRLVYDKYIVKWNFYHGNFMNLTKADYIMWLLQEEGKILQKRPISSKENY